MCVNSEAETHLARPVCCSTDTVFVPPRFAHYNALNSVSANATETLIPTELSCPVASPVLQKLQLEAVEWQLLLMTE